MNEVVCLGIMVADIIAKPVVSLPPKGTLGTVDQIELHIGGCACNTGIGLAKLGVKTGVIGKVGKDGFGDFLISEMKKEGLDVRGVIQSSAASTSATVVIVDEKGERTFIHYYGADGKIKLEDINIGLIKNCQILHIAGTFLMPGFDGKPTANILKKAKEEGKITSLDTAYDAQGKWLSVIEPCLKHIDIFLPSLGEAKKISGEEKPDLIIDFFLKYGIKTIALKMGEKGCLVANTKERIKVLPYKVKPVETTGAGDAFVAGFLKGILKGWSLKETAEFANACGAVSTLSMGATTSIKNTEHILEFMKEHKNAWQK